MLTIEQIKGRIPHRYPFLLVDRVLELEEGKRIVALKNVTINEPFFVGHYPIEPVMPGVLVIEALAQTCGLAVGFGDEKSLPLFAGIDKARFKRMVKPGDTLILKAEILSIRGRVIKAQVQAEVEQELAVKGELTFVVAERGV